MTSRGRANTRLCAAGAAVLAAAACSVQPAVGAQPKTLEGAIAAEQEKLDRHTAGDFAGEWLLFTKDARDHLSQQAFAEYSKACSSIGSKLTVTGGRLEGADRAVVRYELMGFTASATLAYEDGGWYKVPDDFIVRNYGKTGAELIAAEKAEGECKKS